MMLVQRHRDAFARPADGNARIDTPVLNGTAEQVTEVAVVARGLAVRAKVLVGNTPFLEVLLDVVF